MFAKVKSMVFIDSLRLHLNAKTDSSFKGVLKDDKGFILCGTELMKDKSFASLWKIDREPFLPETSVPGIFASGDVRFGAMTGISAAVGEGSMAIRFVRKYLQEM